MASLSLSLTELQEAISHPDDCSCPLCQDYWESEEYSGNIVPHPRYRSSVRALAENEEDFEDQPTLCNGCRTEHLSHGEVCTTCGRYKA